MLDVSVIVRQYLDANWHEPVYISYVQLPLLFIIQIVPHLLAIALITLLERRTMASIQRRRGPNSIGMWGSLQPIADGIKLLLTELLYTSNSSVFIFIAAPLLSLFLMFGVWFIIPVSSAFVIIELQYMLLLVMILGTVNVQTVIFSGWASNSKYAFLGGVRAASQMISYEICMGTVFASVILMSGSFSIIEIVHSQISVWYAIPLLPIWLLFIITSLAETNRAPFDLIEAEAELVAGNNVEYASVLFAAIFIAEYGNILIMSAISTLFFFGGWIPYSCVTLADLQAIDAACSWYCGFIFSVKTAFNVFIFVLVRATVPRYRYDQLMGLGWKILIPSSFTILLVESFIIELCRIY
jgi:NADH-quinone oxidoreductase subunit H